MIYVKDQKKNNEIKLYTRWSCAYIYQYHQYIYIDQWKDLDLCITLSLKAIYNMDYNTVLLHSI